MCATNKTEKSNVTGNCIYFCSLNEILPFSVDYSFQHIAKNNKQVNQLLSAQMALQLVCFLKTLKFRSILLPWHACAS